MNIPLRKALWLDAIATGVMALALVFTANFLQEPLGFPGHILRGIGLFLLAFTGILLFAALRTPVSRTTIWVIIVSNVLWVIDSLILVASGWLALTTVGVMFVLAQAVAVMVFAWIEYAGLVKEHPQTSPQI